MAWSQIFSSESWRVVSLRALPDDGFHASFMASFVQVSAPQLVNQTSLSQVGFGKDGSTKPRVEQQFRDQVLFGRLPASARALMRSQAGPGAGTALSVVPTSYLTQILPHLFRVILLRRLRLPLPPSLLRCRVAVQSIRLATTVLRAQGLECWAEGCSLSKVPLLAFVGRQEDVLGRIV